MGYKGSVQNADPPIWTPLWTPFFPFFRKDGKVYLISEVQENVRNSEQIHAASDLKIKN